MFKNVCEYGNDPELYIQNILKHTNSQQEFLHSVLSKESDERCRNKGWKHPSTFLFSLPAFVVHLHH